MTAEPGHGFLTSLARAYGGAIFFSLPLLMTMEMWQLGFYMDRGRLLLFLVLFLPVLVGLAHFAGFERTSGWWEDVRDALVAVFVGITTAAAVLALLGILRVGMAADELIGKVALTSVPASIGATLAVSQLGGGGEGDEQARSREAISYGGELFLMGAGAIFFAFNVAPTEEMLLIAFRMTRWHMLALAGTSLLLMHAFVYSMEFHGQERAPEGTTGTELFLRFTVVGYAIALLVSAYVLWTFGRYADADLAYVVDTAIVLGFPASLGAAAARLVL